MVVCGTFIWQSCWMPNLWLQVKGLDVDTLFISHIQVNKAQKQRRRTYRAHGRINRTEFVFSLSCPVGFSKRWCLWKCFSNWRPWHVWNCRLTQGNPGVVHNSWMAQWGFLEVNIYCGFSFTAYMSSPCHIELTLSEKEVAVKKEVRFLTVFSKGLYFCLRCTDIT